VMPSTNEWTKSKVAMGGKGMKKNYAAVSMRVLRICENQTKNSNAMKRQR